MATPPPRQGTGSPSSVHNWTRLQRHFFASSPLRATSIQEAYHSPFAPARESLEEPGCLAVHRLQASSTNCISLPPTVVSKNDQQAESLAYIFLSSFDVPAEPVILPPS